jgi:hypothetical protein
MRPLFTVLILVLSSQAALSQRPDSNTSRGMEDDLATLRFLKEVEWPKAYKLQDTILLDRILADEFQMVDSEGGYTRKADQINYVRNHKISYDSFRFEIKRLEIFKGEFAVVTGTGTIAGRDSLGSYKIIYQSSNHLIKRDKLWRAVSSHTSGQKTFRVE